MKKFQVIIFCSFISILVGCGKSSEQTELILKNGQKVKGEVVSTSEEGIEFKNALNNEVRKVPGEEVAFIYDGQDQLQTEKILDKFINAKPKNEVSFEKISRDFQSYYTKEMTFRIIAITPTNFYSGKFYEVSDKFYCVKVSDGNKEAYAYFSKKVFQDKKDEILNFKNNKITVSALVVGGFDLFGKPVYDDGLLSVQSYKTGW